jgi:hypothetical protein
MVTAIPTAGGPKRTRTFGALRDVPYESGTPCSSTRTLISG